jgi:hypothetical protein
MAATFCLDCRRRIERGSRCRACERKRFPASPGRLRGARWQKLREEILAASGNRCANCGRAAIPLEIHHRDHDYTNNVTGNLIPLCKPCHARAALRPPYGAVTPE